MLKYALNFAMATVFSTTLLTATTFTVDKEATKIKWHAEKVTGQHDGNVDIKSGKLNFDDNKLRGGEFTINMKTISNTDIEDPSYKSKLENHLKSEDFFSVEKHPEAKFSITKVEEKNGKHQITGNLTIKGITHPVSFPADITISGDKVVAKADIKVDRSKYNVKFRSKSFFDIKALGDNLIYDEFTISLHLVAQK